MASFILLGHSIRHVSIYVGLGLNHLGLILLLYQCPLRERNNRALGCHTCLLSYLLKETLLPPFSYELLQNMPFGICSPLACPILSLRFMGLRLLLHPYIHRKEKKLTHCIPDFFLSHWEMEMLFRGYKGLYPLTCNMEEKEILVLHMQKKSS